MLGRIGHRASAATTVIGPAVNVASRLESLTKEHGVQSSPPRSSTARAAAAPTPLPEVAVTVRVGTSEPSPCPPHRDGRVLIPLIWSQAPACVGLPEAAQQATTLTARPPCDVSLYLSLMSRPVWRIVSMQLSSGTKCEPSPRSASDAARDRLHRAERVALDAGHLHQPADRVAGHAEMVLERDLGGVLDLRVGGAERGGEPRRGHGGSRADLALAADLGAGDRGVVLDDAADRRGDEQERAHAVAVGADAMVEVVADDGGDDAGRAVGRRGDDPPAGGVLLVDGHGVDARASP